MEEHILLEQLQVDNEKRRFNRVGLSFFAFTLVSFVVAQLIATVYVLIYKAVTGAELTDYPSWFMWTLSIVCIYVFAAPVAYLLLRKLPKASPARRRLSAKSFFFFVALAFFLMIVGSYIGTFINAMISTFTGSSQGGEVSEALMSSDVWLTVVYTGVMAPILEELFFRKLLIDRLQGVGDGIIMLMSGLMFGLFHGNLEQFFYAALLGALLAYIYLHTGNILYCIGIHGIVNFLGGIFPLVMELIRTSVNGGMTNENSISAIDIVFILLAAAPQYILAIIGMVVFIMYFKGLFGKIRKGNLRFSKESAAAFGNAGVILFLVASGVQIILSMIL